MAVVFLHIESVNFVVVEVLFSLRKEFIHSVLYCSIAYCRLSFLVTAFILFGDIPPFPPFFCDVRKSINS